MEAEEEYYTHPDRMRGATRRKQNAMMYQQLKAFETILHTFQRRHEARSLYDALARIVPYNGRVRSLHALNHYAHQWLSDRDTYDQTTITRIEVFNQEIQQLKHMKTHFDDRIYSVLFEFYYEMVMEEIPQATKLVDRGRRASSQVRGSNLLVMSKIDNYGALNEPMPVEQLYDISKDCEKLFTIIHQLQQVDVSWGSLLKSDEVDVELFDPDSVYDVKLYPNYLRFEAVLRLIPDVIRKIKSAIELAKSWWYQAERIRRRLQGQKIRDDTSSDQPSENDQEEDDAVGSLNSDNPPTEQVLQNGHATESLPRHMPEITPGRHDPYRSEETPRSIDEDGSVRSTDLSFNSTPNKTNHPLHLRETLEPDHITPRHTYPAVIETVERRIKELSMSIALRQMDLASETNEMEFFNRRQQRIHKLKSNLKRTINVMEALYDELKGHRRVKEQLLLQVEDADASSQRRHVSGKLKTLDDKVKEIQELSHNIEYRHKLMTSDLKLELDLKETFTRYQNEVRGRVDLLQSSVRDEEEKKAQLENELRLLRLQIGLEEEEQEDTPKKRSNQFSNDLPRQPKARVGGVSWLSEQSMDEFREEDNRDLFSPDLLLVQGVGSRQERKKKPLDRVSTSPDLLDHNRRFSNDNGVIGNRNMHQGNKARPRESRRKPLDLMPETGEDDSDFDRSTDNSNPIKTQNKRISVPEINYFPPSANGKKKHRLPNVSENSFPSGNKDPAGQIPHGFHDRLKDPYQDINHPHGGRAEERTRQRMQPHKTSSYNTLPTRNLNRRPRKSLGLTKKKASAKKPLPLPQVREEESQSPRHGQKPRMYDPKRESFESILSSHSPLPMNSSLGFDGSGKEEFLGVAGRRSRKGKMAQRSKPGKISDQPDLLSPLNQPNRAQRRKQPQVSRIPIKTTY